jgi:hypothetical protein
LEGYGRVIAIENMKFVSVFYNTETNAETNAETP